MKGQITSSLAILFLMFVALGAQQYYANQELGKTVNAYNYTESVFSNSTLNSSYSLDSRAYAVDSSFRAFVMEFSKMLFQFGYENPQFDFSFLLLLFVAVILAPLVIPIIAIIYILFEWLKEKVRGG